jgi:hypothetical protein
VVVFCRVVINLGAEEEDEEVAADDEDAVDTLNSSFFSYSFRHF